MTAGVASVGIKGAEDVGQVFQVGSGEVEVGDSSSGG